MTELNDLGNNPIMQAQMDELAEQYDAAMKPEFNYEELALRTLPKNNQYHSDKITSAQWFSVIHNAIVALQELDALKKTFAYGKPLELDFEYGEDEIEMFSENIDPDIVHGIIGVATEAGELLESLALVLFDNEEFDLVNLKEEVGDLMWYQAILAVRGGFTLTDCQITNILKLEERYGDKFTAEKALIRDLARERGILEA